MTQEEKAKAYDEALERMKSWVRGEHPECFTEAQKAAEFIFPELAESEDEKLRKEIISIVKSYRKWCINEENHRFDDCITWLEKQGEPADKGEISDGYHTFNELYYYRMLYNAAFFNMLPKEWVHKSKKHNDGEECFGGGWFIVMANLPTGQISNHYELKDWDLFQIPEKEVADKWDGHTPQEAADRLHKYLLEKQGDNQKLDGTFVNVDEVRDNFMDTVYNILSDDSALNDRANLIIDAFDKLPSININNQYPQILANSAKTCKNKQKLLPKWNQLHNN